MSSLVATVDLNDADAGARIADSLGASGFVCVTGHGVADGLLDRAYATAARLFALPEAAKKACEDPASGRQRGYTPYLLEQAKDHDTPDLKEFWQVARPLPSDHPLVTSGRMAPNRFPGALPEAETTFLELYAALERVALFALGHVEQWLGCESGLFREMTRDGDSILRVIHYPPLPEGAPPNAVRAAAHGDINLMTVLPASTAPGLELLTREGAWEPVVPPPGAMILDTGDMMARITGNRLPATIHRVVNPDDAGAGARYSIPFFLHPHPDAILAPLTEDAEPAIVAREFLDERLRAIGVL